MKKQLFLFAMGLIGSVSQAANYFVEPGTQGAASWNETVVTDNNGIRVNLAIEGKSFNEWFSATFKTTPSEVATVNLIQGTYIQTGNMSTVSSVHIYGGFDGSSTNTANRQKAGLDPWDFTRPTIIDCKNQYYFSNAGGTRSNVVYDGLTFKDGGPVTIKWRGSEILQNCKLLNCINSNTAAKGASVLIYGGGTIRGCYFENSNASASDSKGGAIAIIGTSAANPAIVDRCLFVNNQASMGGAIYTESSANISNSIFRGNSNGTILYILSNNALHTFNIANCNFVNNTVQPLYISGTSGKQNIYNCVFWADPSLTNGNVSFTGGASENTVVKNCAMRTDLVAGWTTENNFKLSLDNDGQTEGEKYPRFIDPTNNDFRIQKTSALFNTGLDISTLLPSTAVDFFMTTRPQYNSYDIGYFEVNNGSTKNKTITTEALVSISTTPEGIQIINESNLPLTITLHNPSGSHIRNWKFSATEQLNINLNKGMYILSVQGNSQQETIKVLVQ